MNHITGHTHYYNEFNPESAAMLRQLMLDGIIPKGHVDERSITEVTPDDLRGYKQCHFFAGIGGWSIALRLAGWPEDRECWTGSCPCQPFSAAGLQKGKSDDRHLWPIWERLIAQCRPATVFGEQVASAVAHGWLDDVYQGLEALDYAIGSAVLPAISIGSPHKRDRLWFVANATSNGRNKSLQSIQEEFSERSGGDSDVGYVGNTNNQRLQKYGESYQLCERSERQGPERSTGLSGFWDGTWIECRDGKARLVKPGIALMVDGVSYRRAILHAIGNAIVPQNAAEFIKATM